MSWKNTSVQKRKKNRGGRRSRRRKKRTRKRRLRKKRGGTEEGYNANNQMDNKEERKLDMMERMKRAQKRNALQRYTEHIARPGQIDKLGHGGNTHKNKQYYHKIGKYGGKNPKSKTRQRKTRRHRR